MTGSSGRVLTRGGEVFYGPDVAVERPEIQAPEAQAAPDLRGSYWNDPRNVAMHYLGIQADVDNQVDWAQYGVDPNLVTDAWKYMAKYNEGKTFEDWAPLPSTDMFAQFIAQQPEPTPDGQWRNPASTYDWTQIWGELTPDSLASMGIAAPKQPAQPAAKPPTVSMEQWSTLPSWQKTIYGIQSSGVMSGMATMAPWAALAGISAIATGGLSLAALGAVAAPLALGALIGTTAPGTTIYSKEVAEKLGLKAPPEGGTDLYGALRLQYGNEPWIDVMEKTAGNTLMLLNYPAEKVEQILGTAGQLADSYIKNDGDMQTLLNHIPELWEASRLTYESIGTGVKIPGTDRYLPSPANVVPGIEYLSDMLTKGTTDVRFAPMGYAHVIGQAEPVAVPADGAALIHMATQEMIRNKDVSPSEIVEKYQQAFGFSGQFADLMFQSVLDPLNIMPQVETGALKGFSKITHNPILEAAANTTSKFDAGALRTMQQYKEYLQRPDVWAKGMPAKFTPEGKYQYSTIERIIGGITEEGLVDPVQRSLLGKIDPTGIINKANTLNPQTQVVAAWQTIADALPELYGVVQGDLGAYTNALKLLAGADVQVSADVARMLNSPAIATARQMLKDFDVSSFDSMLKARELGTRSEAAIRNLATATGREYNDVLAVLVRGSDAELDVLLKQFDTASAGSNPIAGVTPDEIRGMAKLFKDAPYAASDDHFIAHASAKLDDHVVKTAEKMMGDTKVKGWENLVAAGKAVQNAIFLHLNPGYLVNNVVTNNVHRMFDGVYGLATGKHIDNFFDNTFKMGTSRLHQGFGAAEYRNVAGELDNAYAKLKSAIRKARRSGDVTQKMADVAEEASQMVAIMSKLSAQAEARHGASAVYYGVRKSYPDIAKNVIGDLDPQLKADLKRLGYDPKRILDIMRHETNPDAAAAKLNAYMGGQGLRPNAAALVDEIVGPKYGQGVAKLLNESGVIDELQGYLDKGMEPRQARKKLAIQLDDTIKEYIAREAPNIVAEQSALASSDPSNVMRMMVGRFQARSEMDARHAARMTSMWEATRDMEYTERNHWIDSIMTEEDKAFANLREINQAYWVGNAEGMKLQGTDAWKGMVVQRKGIDDGWQKYHDVKRQTWKDFSKDMKKRNLTADDMVWWDEYRQVQEVLGKMYEDMADQELRLSLEMGKFFEDSILSQYPDLNPGQKAALRDVWLESAAATLKHRQLINDIRRWERGDEGAYQTPEFNAFIEQHPEIRGKGEMWSKFYEEVLMPGVQWEYGVQTAAVNRLNNALYGTDLEVAEMPALQVYKDKLSEYEFARALFTELPAEQMAVAENAWAEVPAAEVAPVVEPVPVAEPAPAAAAVVKELGMMTAEKASVEQPKLTIPEERVVMYYKGTHEEMLARQKHFKENIPLGTEGNLIDRFGDIVRDEYMNPVIATVVNGRLTEASGKKAGTKYEVKGFESIKNGKKSFGDATSMFEPFEENLSYWYSEPELSKRQPPSALAPPPSGLPYDIAPMTPERLRQRVTEAFPDYTPEQVTAHMAIVDQLVESIAKRTGKSKAELYNEIADVRPGSEADMQNQVLKAGAEEGTRAAGAYELIDDGRALIHAFEGKNISTFSHEVFHVYDKYMPEADKAIVLDWLQETEWKDSVREWTADAWNKYLSEGKAPSNKLADVFLRMRDWLLDIWRRVEDPASRMELSDEVRGVFDRMLGDKAQEILNEWEGRKPGDTMLQITPEQARSLNIETKIPDEPLFLQAINNTPGTRITDEGIFINLVRSQKPEQGGRPSVRTGVFYLVAGDKNLKYYRTGKVGYGGEELVSGETLIKRPIVAKGGTGGKVPERAYDSVVGKGAYEKMREDALRAQGSLARWGLSDEQNILSRVRAFLYQYGDSSVAEDIIKHSTQGNQLAYALQENAVATALREAGYDSVIGYNLRKDGTAFISEVFDLREITYPSRFTKSKVHPDYLKQGTDEFGQPLFQKQPASSAPLLPGAAEHMLKQPSGAETQAEGYYHYMQPALDAILLRMEKEGITPSGGALPPDVAGKLKQYLGQAMSQQTQAKAAAVRVGLNMRDFSLLNYDKRYNFDTGLSAFFPYQFWMTRSMANWAIRALDKPSILSHFARLAQFMSTYDDEEKWLPTRLRGKVRIGIPGLPEWAGGGVFFDPIRKIFPFMEFMRPYEQIVRNQSAVENKANDLLRQWAVDGEITYAEAQEAKRTRSGPLWDKAAAESQGEEGMDIMDTMGLLMSPALYLTFPFKKLTGQEEEIGPFPTSRLKQALSAALGIDLPMKGNLINKNPSVAAFGKWGDWYIDRQISNMVGDGTVDAKAGQQAIITHEGPIYEQAVERVRMEVMLKTPGALPVYMGRQALKGEAGLTDVLGSLAMGWLPNDLLPQGELELRGLQDEYSQAFDLYHQGDRGAIDRFLTEHPEYSARVTLFKEPEERLPAFLKNEVWDGYTALPSAERSYYVEAFGQEFQDFLDGNTDDIDTETLASWARTMGGAAAGVDAQSINVPKPEQNVLMQLQQFKDMVEQQYPGYSQVRSYIYGLPEDKREAAWNLIPGSEKIQQMEYIFMSQNPKTIEHLAPSWILEYDPPVQKSLVDFYASQALMFPNIGDTWEQYWQTEQGAERRSFWNAHPELEAQSDWKKEYVRMFPQLKGIVSKEKPKPAGMISNIAEKMQEYPMLAMHVGLGVELSTGEKKMLEYIWEESGRPYGSLSTFLQAFGYAQ